jgi:hypothetical protein
MSSFQVSNAQIRDGVWHGTLAGGTGVPRIEVLHLDKPIPDVSVAETEQGWHVQVPVPSEAISDGVQTFVVMDKTAQEKLTDFSLIAGEALGDDLRAEVDLLRAELDMLKRAFRRHCVETA